MSTLTEREAHTYADALTLPHYGEYSPGETYAPVFASVVPPPATVLDAGAGIGKGLRALSALGFTVTGCDLPDLGIAGIRSGVCLWKPQTLPRGPYDYVYCTDVLEHIPPEFTMLVVRNLLDVCTRGLFLSISLVPDSFGVWLGTPLHLTVRRYDEWLSSLRELGTIVDARDLGATGLYLVQP